MIRPILYIILSTLLIAETVQAKELSFNSGLKQMDVIEVFTSEGCSSCPPADAWLSGIARQDRAFQNVIALSFHVDYWNWLGWTDRFSHADYTQRQRDYVNSGALSQAYTPGILVNSQEWRDWFRGKRQWPNSTNQPGNLNLTISGQRAIVNFEQSKPMVAHVAVLGMGITSNVARGENRGKTLQHDFVVLAVQQSQGQNQWQFTLPTRDKLVKADHYAVVAWVSPENSPAIVQAVGGRWTTAQP